MGVSRDGVGSVTITTGVARSLFEGPGYFLCGRPLDRIVATLHKLLGSTRPSRTSHDKAGGLLPPGDQLTKGLVLDKKGVISFEARRYHQSGGATESNETRL
jgi:hypothetical protein